jgi:succinyl-CoA synthetase beta subunit
MKLDVIGQILARAREEGRRVLLETEGLALLDAMGIARPRHLFVRSSAEAAALPSTGLPGAQAVVKVVSPDILHKSDVGGVAVVANVPAEIADAIRDMERRLADRALAGFLVMEFVRFDASLGGELLAGLRWTEEFGPVVTIGAGGITTERLAEDLRPGREAAIVSPHLPASGLAGMLDEVAAVQLATRPFRGRAPRADLTQVTAAASHLMALARAFMPEGIAECELNPCAVTPAGLVALDVLVTLADAPAGRRAAAPAGQARPSSPAGQRRHHRRVRAAQPRTHHPQQSVARWLRSRARGDRQARRRDDRRLPLLSGRGVAAGARRPLRAGGGGRAGAGSPEGRRAP